MEINNIFEVYLEDLKEEKQKELLNFWDAKKEDNFDISPIFVFEK